MEKVGGKEKNDLIGLRDFFSWKASYVLNGTEVKFEMQARRDFELKVRTSSILSALAPQ